MKTQKISTIANGLELVNPTGKGIVEINDPPSCYGIGYECEPMQPVLMPVQGIILREAWPFQIIKELDYSWRGVYISNPQIEIILYFLNASNAVGFRFEAGEPIGNAQDISLKYPGLKPHVYMEIVNVSPRLLFKGIEDI